LEAPKELEFYSGVKEIAQFLGRNPHTVKRWLREGKIPAKKDRSGRWVLCY
jgi:excisionase family DNA binding protein